MSDHVQEVHYWYGAYLRREPDPAGEKFWAGKLDSGENPSQALSEFLACDEYYELAGGFAKGYVKTLYIDIWRRLPDSGAVAKLVASLEANTLTRQQVAYGIIMGLQ